MFRDNCECDVHVGVGDSLHLDNCIAASNQGLNVRVDAGAVIVADKLAIFLTPTGCLLKARSISATVT
jgi:hypothetical protein